MIYYFSATGNNKYVAEKIAAALCDKAISIQDCFDGNSYTLPDDELIGFVSPTYALGLPEIYKRFFGLISPSKTKTQYIFFVATYGTTSGFIDKAASKTLKQRDIAINAFFNIKMPDNWTPTFDLTDAKKVEEANRKADLELEEVIKHIQAKDTGNFMKRRVPYIASAIALPEYEKMRKTSNFVVEDTCISCGLCEKKCPDKAIQMDGGKPAWAKDRCIMCLGCLHRCPKFAIQYGDRTKNHGQYMHSGVVIS